MKNGKEIINKIFAITGILEKSGNEDIFHEFGLSVSSCVPLKKIFSGLQTIAQMKKISNESVASLGQKIKKLENLGLVKRHLDKQDKRKWNFTITSKGEEILQKVESRFGDVGENLFSGFSEQEKQQLWNLLGKIEAELGR